MGLDFSIAPVYITHSFIIVMLRAGVWVSSFKPPQLEACWKFLVGGLHHMAVVETTSQSVLVLLRGVYCYEQIPWPRQDLIGVGLQVQRFSPLSSRQEHGSIQAGMAQEELRVLHLHLKAASGILTSRKLG